MKPQDERDDRDFSEYREWGQLHYPAIGEALRQIDDARANLIAAQNNLVTVLRRINNEYAHQRFTEFYNAGGVTAADWEASYKQQYMEPNPAFRICRQLRVVAGNKNSNKKSKPRLRQSNSGGEGPQAA